MQPRLLAPVLGTLLTMAHALPINVSAAPTCTFSGPDVTVPSRHGFLTMELIFFPLMLNEHNSVLLPAERITKCATEGEARPDDGPDALYISAVDIDGQANETDVGQAQDSVTIPAKTSVAPKARAPETRGLDD